MGLKYPLTLVMKPRFGPTKTKVVSSENAMRAFAVSQAKSSEDRDAFQALGDIEFVSAGDITEKQAIAYIKSTATVTFGMKAAKKPWDPPTDEDLDAIECIERNNGLVGDKW